MNSHSRVNKLLEQARNKAVMHRKAIRRRRCLNATWEELLQMVEEAIAPESWPVVEDIIGQMEEYHQRPPRELANGETIENTHGFYEWLELLHAGSGDLPETIPHVVLLAWRNGYANHPANSTPVPIRRCEDCKMILPNCTVDGHGPCITPCPVCGSDAIGHAYLDKWPYRYHLDWGNRAARTGGKGRSTNR